MKKLMLSFLLVAFIPAMAFGQLQVYDANGQLLGVTDYTKIVGGNSIEIFIPNLMATINFIGIAETGPASINNPGYYLVGESGDLFGFNHHVVIQVCDRFFVGIMDRHTEITITDRYENPCTREQYDPPRLITGGFYKLIEVFESDFPFSFPAMAPFEIRLFDRGWGKPPKD